MASGRRWPQPDLTLKPQQRFASGNPLRPEDVIFSLVRAVKLNKAPSFILGEFGWTPDNVEQQLKKVGDNQVQLRWPANIGSELALRLLTANVASIVDEKLLNEHAQQGTTAMPGCAAIPPAAVRIG